ncbi:MAG: hypothetical protein R2774_05560 [Saprospiraceae bacterium]
MSLFSYPLKFEFKVLTFAPQFSVTDSNGQEIFYVHQKLFKLKEDISVFSNKSKADLIYKIKADKWIDWSTSYVFTNVKDGNFIGRVGRKGMKSLWKATYEIFDEQNTPDFKVQEGNGFVKIMDGLIGEIPILGFFSGYIFNPQYHISNKLGEKIATFSKEPSMLGTTFKLSDVHGLSKDEELRVVLSLIMMVFLERTRG